MSSRDEENAAVARAIIRDLGEVRARQYLEMLESSREQRMALMDSFVWDTDSYWGPASFILLDEHAEAEVIRHRFAEGLRRELGGPLPSTDPPPRPDVD